MRPGRVTIGELLRRQAMELEARKHTCVYDGQPSPPFTEEEAARLAFARWRAEQQDLEGVKGDD